MHAPARYRSFVTEAKDDTPASAEIESAQESAAEPAPESEPVSAQDDARRRFREVLDRKNATPGQHPGSQVDGSSQMKSSNGKRQRQFRRKSG
jgi:hypothetical protein